MCWWARQQSVKKKKQALVFISVTMVVKIMEVWHHSVTSQSVCVCVQVGHKETIWTLISKQYYSVTLMFCKHFTSLVLCSDTWAQLVTISWSPSDFTVPGTKQEVASRCFRAEQVSQSSFIPLSAWQGWFYLQRSVSGLSHFSTSAHWRCFFLLVWVKKSD